jgi:hypothetical protein
MWQVTVFWYVGPDTYEFRTLEWVRDSLALTGRDMLGDYMICDPSGNLHSAHFHALIEA